VNIVQGNMLYLDNKNVSMGEHIKYDCNYIMTPLTHHICNFSFQSLDADKHL